MPVGMGSSLLGKSTSPGYRIKSGSSAGSDKEMNGKFRRSKIRRPGKDFGVKRVPDYTELAYKEAVSKLKYFLTGAYVPSIRSYGGTASIKNLDESDNDADRKFTPYTTLAEYKPRPRLTAKYSTLYADSLKNYDPPVINVPLPTTTTSANLDSSGGPSPDVAHFIQKQEEYIQQLERESHYCRDELNNLLGKVKEVISENEHLHEAQKNKLISRMFHTRAASESDDIDDSTGLDSDHKVSPSKPRKTSKFRGSGLEGPNIVFESRIAELEAQLSQAKIDLKKMQDENNENKRKLASGIVDSSCLDGFKRQIDNLQRDKTTLEGQISKLKVNLEYRDGDENRYKRSSDLVEQQLREERNNLEAEIGRLKDELSEERSKTRELTGEGARRLVRERSAAEQRYHKHFDELQHDLAAQYDQVAKLQLELERQRRDENEIKREVSMKNNIIDELRMELKNKISTLQVDMAQVHAEKSSIEEELANARLAIERHQRQAKHEANRLNSEIQSLRQRLDRADADLVHSRRDNLRLSEQISNLEKEINLKNLTPTSPVKKNKEKELSTILTSIENKHAKTVAELESMIQSQNSLMEKLTGDCRLLTDKLDDANRRHKTELGSLQRQVETLGRSFQARSPAPSAYTAPATHTTTANEIDPYPASDTRQYYTGSDSTRDTEIRDSTNADVRQNRNDSRRESILPDHRPISKQSSKTSLLKENILTSNSEEQPAHYTEQSISNNNDNIVDNTQFINQNLAEKPMETDQVQSYEQTNQVQGYEPTDQVQSYEQTNQVQGYEQTNQVQGYEQTYEQNYDQTYDPSHDQSLNQSQDIQYQNNDQNQYQPQVDYQQHDGQYTGQYEQYDEQQYPSQYETNAQYEGQNQNYGANDYQTESQIENNQVYDTNQTFDNVQHYDNTQSDQNHSQAQYHEEEVPVPNQNVPINHNVPTNQNIPINQTVQQSQQRPTAKQNVQSAKNIENKRSMSPKERKPAQS